MGVVKVFKSLAGDWSTTCDECDAWLWANTEWSDAMVDAVAHAASHEAKRCEHCGRTS